MNITRRTFIKLLGLNIIGFTCFGALPKPVPSIPTKNIYYWDEYRDCWVVGYAPVRLYASEQMHSGLVKNMIQVTESDYKLIRSGFI